MANTRRRKVKKSNTERNLKTALHYATGLLVNIIILFLIVRVFSIAFNFSYDVFADSAKNPGSLDYVVVEIPPDSSTSEIATILYDEGLIANKYVMMAKIKIGEYGNDIKSGKYGLSSSMTYDEILNIICGIEPEEE